MQWYTRDLIPTPNLSEPGKSFSIPANLHKREGADNIVCLQLNMQDACALLQKGVKESSRRKLFWIRKWPYSWRIWSANPRTPGIVWIVFSTLQNDLIAHFFYSLWQPETYWMNRWNTVWGLHTYWARPYWQCHMKWTEDRPDLFWSGEGNSLDFKCSFSFNLPLELGTTGQNWETRPVWIPSLGRE